MEKPRYMEKLLKIIFAWLGVMFVCRGILRVLRFSVKNIFLPRNTLTYDM